MFAGWHAAAIGGGGHTDQAGTGQQPELLGPLQPGGSILAYCGPRPAGHQVPQTRPLLLRRKCSGE